MTQAAINHDLVLKEVVAGGVDSEVGQLRRALIHRPGLELSRLTRDNRKDLLFDDAVWAARASQEHDAFADVLIEHEVAVLYFGVLLAEALESDLARAFVLDRLCTPEAVGPEVLSPLREFLEALDAADLAEVLIGGVTRSELSVAGRAARRWPGLPQDGFILGPLPNTLFQRDDSAWIGTALTISPMSQAARWRETLNSRVVYRFHPAFRAVASAVSGDEDPGAVPDLASREGGNIHVLGRGIVMIGVGERSTPAGVEILSRQLFASGQASTVIAVQTPPLPASAHLDELLTMVDDHTFVVHHHLDPRTLRHWLITPEDRPEMAENATGALRFEVRDDLFGTIGDVLGVEVRTLSTKENDGRPYTEQRDDACSYLALAPGLVVGYERDTQTNRMLRDHGVKVVSIPGNELGRVRSGPRSLICPVQRDGI